MPDRHIERYETRHVTRYETPAVTPPDFRVTCEFVDGAPPIGLVLQVSDGAFRHRALAVDPLDALQVQRAWLWLAAWAWSAAERVAPEPAGAAEEPRR